MVKRFWLVEMGGCWGGDESLDCGDGSLVTFDSRLSSISYNNACNLQYIGERLQGLKLNVEIIE